MFRNLFWTYLKIGTFTLGGGYAMLPLIQREVVDRKGWIDEEEFLNMIALAQAAPGLIAVNSAIFIGWRIGGWKGVCGAVLGAVLPSFLIILTIAMVFREWKELPAVEAVFKGIRPAVVALIAAPLVKMARSAIGGELKNQNAKIKIKAALPLSVSLAAALLIWLGGVNPVWVILATIVITLVVQSINKDEGKNKDEGHNKDEGQMYDVRRKGKS
ncbi:MAG: chromate transporter [Paludibacteraceae bacterium]|nr:chromate transporter [Paludibacteraceae bacterium]